MRATAFWKLYLGSFFHKTPLSSVPRHNDSYRVLQTYRGCASYRLGRWIATELLGTLRSFLIACRHFLWVLFYESQKVDHTDSWIIVTVAYKRMYRYIVKIQLKVHVWSWKGRLYTAPGVRLNINMSSYRYRDSHYKDKTVLRSSYLYNGNPHTCKKISLFRAGFLASDPSDVDRGSGTLPNAM